MSLDMEAVMAETERIRGRIKRVKVMDGYGFITSGGVDYFFHKSALASDLELSVELFAGLTEGDTVEFTPGKGDKGPNASKVVEVAP